MADAFTLRVDAAAVIGWLGMQSTQAPYAISAALNRTAEDANLEGRARYPQYFHARSPGVPTFAFPIPIPPGERATKTKLAVTLEPTRIGAVLAPFETGQPHTVDRLGRLVAVPSFGPGGLRASPMTVIPRSLYPQNLGLQPKRTPQGTTYFALGKGAIKRNLKPASFQRNGNTIMVGKAGTYQITTPDGKIMIFQRTGRGKGQLLWTLKASVRRPADLQYFATIQRVADQRWPINMAGAMQAALRTAR